MLLCYKSPIIRATRAPRQHKLVTGNAKGIVPSPRKAGEELFYGAPANSDTRVNYFPPSMDARTLLALFKGDPLRHGDADGVVYPAYFLSRDACGNYVVDDGIYGAQKFNLETATGLPRVAVAPSHFAVDIGEVVPAMYIRENEPGERWAGLCDNGVFKSSHDLFLTSPY